MKRIAIFCDGTWDTPDLPYPTNVYLLYKAARRTAADGTIQLIRYIPGVGTGFGKAGIARQWDRLVGGALGVGVTRNILAAYIYLAEHYEPGDQVFIFGFSRGAYTARALTGLIRASGLPRHGETHRAPAALRRYRAAGGQTHPNTEASHRFRLGYSPDLATSQQEIDWRVARGHPAPPLFTVSYLGVWDTVGAMGIPGHHRILSLLAHGSQGFHDTGLTGMVRAARHAVAIDETRRSFPPALWRNLDSLPTGGPGQGARPYLQHWFAGDHGSVGGGGDIVGLSNITLRWVARGARDGGLEFDPTALAVLAAEEDEFAPLCNQTLPPDLLTRLVSRRGAPRTGALGPASVENIAASAARRWRGDPAYRPPGLAPFAAALARPPD